jgi:hypothetical protein
METWKDISDSGDVV